MGINQGTSEEFKSYVIMWNLGTEKKPNFERYWNPPDTYSDEHTDFDKAKKMLEKLKAKHPKRQFRLFRVTESWIDTQW